MRNILLVALAVFFTVLLGSAAIMWFLQAESMTKFIEEEIAAINKPETFLAYEKIETSGFPFALDISVINPRFTGSVDRFAALQFGIGDIDAIPSFQTPKSWTEDISLQGKLTFSVSPFSNKYSITGTGELANTSFLRGATYFTSMQSEGATRCDISVKKNFSLFDGLWSFKRIKNDDFGDNITAFECTQPTSNVYSLKDGPTGEKDILFSFGPQRVSLLHTIEKERRKMRVELTSSDLLVTTAGNELLYLYKTSLSPHGMPTRYDILGKQNQAFAATIEMPVQITDYLKDNITLNVEKAVEDNELFATQGMLSYTSVTDNNSRNIVLKGSADFIPKPNFDMLTTFKLRDLFQFIYRGSDPKFAQTREALKTYNEETVQHIVGDIIPRVEMLKNMGYSTEISYQGDADFTSGTITVGGLRVGASPYYIGSTGTIRLLKNAMPMVDMNVKCGGCEYLINDVTDYLNRLQVAYGRFSPVDAEQYAIDPRAAEAFKVTVRNVAGKPEASMRDEMSFDVKSDIAGQFTFNGKSPAEILLTYNMLLPQKQQ